MSKFIKPTLILAAFGLFAGGQVRAQSSDKDFIERWAQAHPQVTLIEASAFAKLSPVEQAGRQWLVFEPGGPSRDEILRFEARLQGGEQARPDKLQHYQAKQGSRPISPEPSPTKYRVTQADWQTMPASKRDHVLANPELYELEN